MAEKRTTDTDYKYRGINIDIADDEHITTAEVKEETCTLNNNPENDMIDGWETNE